MRPVFALWLQTRLFNLNLLGDHAQKCHTFGLQAGQTARRSFLYNHLDLRRGHLGGPSWCPEAMALIPEINRPPMVKQRCHTPFHIRLIGQYAAPGIHRRMHK
ncbi:hypothetical protein PILCRDRAFT_345257 [Piloderma croceum F 1598]|uniref:Uncharacterized protein n=1 Tax=Piloderma croceum (strain F 1598) TaxID=765440 RepID=A0A0C3FPA4_PILCF|nr:hypothetical protein PILCRDRAFT_345257 [Piloderma croceum F 1598]